MNAMKMKRLPVGFLMCLASLGCGKPAEPVNLSPFVSAYELKSIDSSGAIQEPVPIDPESGLYALIHLSPTADFPKEWKGRAVQSPERWPIVIHVTPAGESREYENTMNIPVNRFRHPKEPKKRISEVSAASAEAVWMKASPYGSANPFWQTRGCDGEPDKPPEWNQDEYRYWTYLIAPPEPGDYTFEVALYPTFAPRSAVRNEFGEPLILQRGVIHVGDAGKSSASS